MTDPQKENEEIEAVILQMRRDDRRTGLKLGASLILVFLAIYLVGSGVLAIHSIITQALTGHP